MARIPRDAVAHGTHSHASSLGGASVLARIAVAFVSLVLGSAAVFGAFAAIGSVGSSGGPAVLVLGLGLLALAFPGIIVLAAGATRAWPHHWWQWGIPAAVPSIVAGVFLFQFSYAGVGTTIDPERQRETLLSSVGGFLIVLAFGGIVYGAGLLGGIIGRRWDDPSARFPRIWRTWGPVAVYLVALMAGGASVAFFSGYIYRNGPLTPLVGGSVVICLLAFAATPAWPRHRHFWGLASALPFFIFYFHFYLVDPIESDGTEFGPARAGRWILSSAMLSAPLYAGSQLGGWLGLWRQRRHAVPEADPAP